METSNSNPMPEMESANSSAAPKITRNPLVVIIAGVVLVLAIFAIIGWWSGGRGLSVEERMQLLDKLEVGSTTEAERAALLEDLEVGTTTPESRVNLLNNLKTN